MAYPTGTLSIALEEIDREMVAIKSYCQSVSSQLASASQKAALIIDLHANLGVVKNRLATWAATPGLPAYAKQQKDNVNLDVIAEYQAVVAAIDAVRSNVESTFPKDASGYLLREQWATVGITERSFAPSSTVQLRTLLNTLVAAIN